MTTRWLETVYQSGRKGGGATYVQESKRSHCFKIKN
jgi:hypothetical protein